MSRWDTRIGRNHYSPRASVLAFTARKISRVVGRAMGLEGARRQGLAGLEQLEPRQLLGGQGLAMVPSAGKHRIGQCEHNRDGVEVDGPAAAQPDNVGQVDGPHHRIGTGRRANCTAKRSSASSWLSRAHVLTT